MDGQAVGGRGARLPAARRHAVDGHGARLPAALVARPWMAAGRAFPLPLSLSLALRAWGLRALYSTACRSG